MLGPEKLVDAVEDLVVDQDGAEEGLLGALDPDQRDALADEALDPLSYVDPSIVDVLSELDRP